jgi:hypothetical protein
MSDIKKFLALSISLLLQRPCPAQTISAPEAVAPTAIAAPVSPRSLPAFSFQFAQRFRGLAASLRAPVRPSSPEAGRSRAESQFRLLIGARPDAVRPLEGQEAATLSFTLGTPADVYALGPVHKVSIGKGIQAQLRKLVSKHGPLKIFVHRDRFGGQFAALDLRSSSDWLDFDPQLQDHEKAAVHKILEIERDVEVLLATENGTPDLIVRGRVTELKSHDSVRDSLYTGLTLEESLQKHLEKANRQIFDFSWKHGLPGGDLVIDLSREEAVPPEVESIINAWSASREMAPALGRIRVQALNEARVFELQADGTYKVVGPKGRPRKAAPPIKPIRVDRYGQGADFRVIQR